MQNLSKATETISISTQDINVGLWGLVTLLLFSVLKFFKWFFKREMALRQERDHAMKIVLKEEIIKDLEKVLRDMMAIPLKKIEEATHGKMEKHDAVLLNILDATNKLREGK